MTSKQLFFCCYNRSAIFFFSARAVQIFFIVIFFARGGGLKLSLYVLYVFHHNNKFNLIKIYSAKTITIEYKKNYGSIYVVNKNLFYSASSSTPFHEINWSAPKGNSRRATRAYTA